MGYYCGGVKRYDKNISKLFFLLGAWAAVASIAVGAPLLTWWSFDAYVGKITLSFDEPMADVFLGSLQIGSKGSCNLQPHVEVAPQVVTSIEFTTSSTELNLYLDAEFFDSLKVGHLRIASLERMFICIEAGSFINTIGEVNLPIYGGKIMGSEGFTAMAIVPDDVSPSIIRHTFDPKQLTEHLFFDEAVDWSTASASSITLSIPPFSVRLECSTIEKGSSKYYLDSRELVVNLNSLCDNSTTETSWNDLNVLNAVLGSDWMLSPQSIVLILDEGFVSDYASPANYAGGVASLTAQGPDCNSCGRGSEAATFCSVACDTVHDAECSVCSYLDGCPLYHFYRANCTAETDTDCAPCTTCIFGTYESTKCGIANDASCSECTRCNDSEWQASDCTREQDRICKSCFIPCNEWNEGTFSQCKSSEAIQWYGDNCGEFNHASY